MIGRREAARGAQEEEAVERVAFRVADRRLLGLGRHGDAFLLREALEDVGARGPVTLPWALVARRRPAERSERRSGAALADPDRSRSEELPRVAAAGHRFSEGQGEHRDAVEPPEREEERDDGVPGLLEEADVRRRERRLESTVDGTAGSLRETSRQADRHSRGVS